MTGVLELMELAADELSLVRPTDITDVTDDPTALKLSRLLHRTCKQLAAEYDWARLRREHTFTTIAAETQTGAFPDDFLRFVNDSGWNRTRNNRLYGPVTSQEWQQTKGLNVNVAYQHFYVRGAALLITPTPEAGDTIAFEYITKNIGADLSGSNELANFVSDDDTAFFDDELVILGMVWRYRKSEGLDYLEEFREYQMRRANMIKADGGRRMLDMNNPSIERPANVTGGNIVDLTTI